LRERDLQIGRRKSGIAIRAWLLDWLDCSGCEFPLYWEIRVRLVGAEGAGLDAAIKDASQRGLALCDFFKGRLDGFGDALPGSFRS
jgi:hypothetical protein